MPLDNAATAPAPVNSASSSSNASMSGPAGATQLESKAASSSSRSCGPTSGGDSRIFQDVAALTSTSVSARRVGESAPSAARLRTHGTELADTCRLQAQPDPLGDHGRPARAARPEPRCRTWSSGRPDSRRPAANCRPTPRCACSKERGVDVSAYLSHYLNTSGVVGRRSHRHRRTQARGRDRRSLARGVRQHLYAARDRRTRRTHRRPGGRRLDGRVARTRCTPTDPIRSATSTPRSARSPIPPDARRRSGRPRSTRIDDLTARLITLLA